MVRLSSTDSLSEWVIFRRESGAVANGLAVTARKIL
jgi:hypothetical protein